MPKWRHKNRPKPNKPKPPLPWLWLPVLLMPPLPLLMPLLLEKDPAPEMTLELEMLVVGMEAVEMLGVVGMEVGTLQDLLGLGTEKGPGE
jgi:hypothetical protein